MVRDTAAGSAPTQCAGWPVKRSKSVTSALLKFGLAILALAAPVAAQPDQAAVDSFAQRAKAESNRVQEMLERLPSGVEAAWSEAGDTGTVVFHHDKTLSSGRRLREFTFTIRREGLEGKINGLRCRDEAGVWDTCGLEDSYEFRVVSARPLPHPVSQRGSLIVQSGTSGGRTTVSPNLDVTVKDSAGNVVLSGIKLPLERSLDAGQYSLIATSDGAKLAAADVVIAAYASTRVQLFPPVGRLVLRVQPRPGVMESGDPVAWTVRSTEATVLAIERNAATLDEALPAGRYEVVVQTDQGGAISKSFIVSAGKITADAISLR